MHSRNDVPAIFFARIVSAGGPYRVDDALAIAYSAATVGRLVGLEAAVRTRCAQYERTAIPEIVSAIVEYAAAPYVAGEKLTLYFVDPAIARIGRDRSRSQTLDDVAETLDEPEAIEGMLGVGETVRQASHSSVSYLANGRSPSPHLQEGEPMTLRANDRMTHARTSSDRVASETAKDDGLPGAFAGDRTVLEGASEPVPDEFAQADGAEPPSASGPDTRDVLAVEHSEHADRVSEFVNADGGTPPTTARTPEPASGIIVRLDWSAERVRRFIAVVDRLFTIDRLGWYRHALAMRLLIPDEIRSGDELADVEAMRHLHALRSAAVSALGKPLLAACMPGFTVTSDWLETLESSREARAVAGLRDALLPYAIDRADETHDRSLTAAPTETVGFVGKRALLAENATSLESFLPILIPTQSQDAALSARLTDYRDLLVDLFAQTARASDLVRLGALAQTNHSLDDRLWQLVGAVGEAFGGFVHT